MFTGKTAALPLKRRSLRGRRLVVVDIENVVGGAVLTVDQAVWARRSIEEAIALGDREQVVIGSSHVGVMPTGVAWRGPRIVMRSGADGADLALLDVLADESVDERFDEVVLVSGDGIFTDAVASLASAGVAVTVLAHDGGCSRRLRMAAHRTLFFGNAVAGLGGVA